MKKLIFKKSQLLKFQAFQLELRIDEMWLHGSKNDKCT